MMSRLVAGTDLVLSRYYLPFNIWFNSRNKKAATLEGSGFIVSGPELPASFPATVFAGIGAERIFAITAVHLRPRFIDA
jgi:hypothetical protein